MIDSRRVLCSFYFDGAQCFLTSHVESWQRTTAVTQAERPAKFRRDSNAPATESKDDLERQLLFICARLGLRNVRDVSLLNSNQLLHRETSEGPRSVRRCGRGSESTRNSHKGKILKR